MQAFAKVVTALFLIGCGIGGGPTSGSLLKTRVFAALEFLLPLHHCAVAMCSVFMIGIFTGRGEEWRQFAKSPVEIGMMAEKAAADRDAAAFLEVGATMDNVCEACHQVYLPGAAGQVQETRGR